MRARVTDSRLRVWTLVWLLTPFMYWFHIFGCYLRTLEHFSIQTQFNTTVCWNDECYAVLHCGLHCLFTLWMHVWCLGTCLLASATWLTTFILFQVDHSSLSLLPALLSLNPWNKIPKTLAHSKETINKLCNNNNSSCNASRLFASSRPNKEQCSVGGACTHQQQQQSANTNNRWTEWSCSSVSPWRWRL